MILKYKFLLKIALLSCFFAVSQNNDSIAKHSENNYFTDINLNANISFFNTDISSFPRNGFDSSFRLGVGLGLHFNYLIKDNFILTGGVQFNSRGGQYRKKNNNVIVISNEGTNNAYNRKVFILDYLEIPFSVGYNIRKIFDTNYSKDKSPVFISLGIIPGFNTGSRFKQNSFSNSNGSGFGSTNESFDTTDFDNANSFLLSGLVKLNFVVQKTKTGDFINTISFSQSFLDVYNIDSIGGDNYKTKMSAFSLGLGFRFN